MCLIQIFYQATKQNKPKDLKCEEESIVHIPSLGILDYL